MTAKEFRESLEPFFGSKTAAHTAYDNICRAMANALAEGKVIPMPGIGVFKVVEMKARKGRNPRTGEPMEIPARRKVKFTPADALKRALEGKSE